MPSVQDIFFNLLRCELWQKPVKLTLTDQQMRDVIQLSKYQGCVGLVLNALFRNEGNFNKKLLLSYLPAMQYVKNRNRFINHNLKSFIDLLNRHDYHCRVVKGQVIAQCYPDPLLRCSGDIDYYCDESCYEDVKSLLSKRFQVTIENHHSTKHDTFEVGDVHFEQHSLLTDFISDKHRRCWDRELAADMTSPYYVRVEDTDIPTLSPTLHCAYIFIHFFFHLITTGIQLRQFCDWALFMVHYQDQIDTDRLCRILKGTGMYRAYCMLAAILTDHLGMPASAFPFPIPDNAHRNAPRYIRRILEMDAHGYGSAKVTQAGLRHSVQTAFITLRQSMLYFPLAPLEVGLCIPGMFTWFFESRLNGGRHRRKSTA